MWQLQTGYAKRNRGGSMGGDRNMSSPSLKKKRTLFWVTEKDQLGGGKRYPFRLRSQANVELVDKKGMEK